MTYSETYLDEAARILKRLDASAIEGMAEALAALRERGGRLFLIGSGGGAGHASHAACDFRKIAGIEAYAPSDNVSELTARVNDDGWDSAYVEYLRGSRLRAADALLIFSVGGGDRERNVSPNIVRAVELARQVGAGVLGVVGRDGGYTGAQADHCVVIPTVNPETVTPHTEAFQAVVWHLLVSHPALQRHAMKWESMQASAADAAGASA